MAGRRRSRDTKEALVSRHAKRRARYQQARQNAGADPLAQVMAGAEYLRGAVARTRRTVPGNAAATARAAADHLADLADDLFESAIKERRSTR